MCPPGHFRTIARGAGVWWCLSGALVGCGEEPPSELPPRETVRACGADEAPFRLADGGFQCARVGPDLVAVSAGEWPDIAGLAEPVVYVRAGSVGGAGTRERPYGTLREALGATPRPASVAVARGELTVRSTETVTADVVIRGAGVRATVLVGMSSSTLLRVAPPEGMRALVSITRLGIRFNAPTSGCASAADAGAGSIAVEATGAGTRLSLDEVEIVRAGSGLHVDQGATVCARALTVRGSLGHGVKLLAEAKGYFRDVLVEGSCLGGILADHSHVDATRTAVMDNGRDGLALRNVRSGRSCMSDADCVDAELPCPGFLPEFTHAQTCVPRRLRGNTTAEPRCRSTDQLVDFVARRNQVTAMRAERTGVDLETWGEPGPVVYGTRLVLTDTGISPGLVGGDGLYVGAGAHVTLDADLRPRGDAARGLGSAIVGNTRTGILVDSDRRDDMRFPGELHQYGRLDVDGALIGSNRGPGLFVQEDSTVGRIAYSRINDNRALGIGVTTRASVATILCDQCIHTRLGTLVTAGSSGVMFTVGDGLSMSEGSGGPVAPDGSRRDRTVIMGSVFSDNQRFGLVVQDNVSAQLQGGNSGSGNALEVPVSSLRTLGDPASPIYGRAPAPATPVIASGSLNPAAAR